MISVCIPTYNGEKYIKEQINSILAQINSSDEIVISDDHSTDKTIEIIEGIKDSRIKVFLRDRSSNSGDTLSKVSSNVQNALSKAQGDYIFLSDQDDIWLEERVSSALPFLEKATPVAVVCNCKVVSDNNDVLIESYFDYIKPSSNILRTIYKSSFHGCCMAFNRAVLNKAFPFPKYSVGHDLWLGIIARIYGQVYFVDRALVLYRRHSSTVTTTGFKSKRSVNDKVKYRLLIIGSILNRFFK